MPKLWNDTIEGHRRDVQAAVIGATAALVAEHGLLGVTMSRIAEDTGIGRATLYKYFPDVESILIAWHEQQMAGHLHHLVAVRDHGSDAADRLRGVLEAYALMVNDAAKHHGTDLSGLIHRPDRMTETEDRLRALVRDLIADAAAAGDVRADVAADELTVFCLNAVMAAGRLPSKAAVRRLVSVTLSGLHG